MSLHLRPALAALVLVVGAASASCSDDSPRPRVAPSSSAASTASPTPTPTDEVQPIRGDQVVRAWLKAFSEAMATGETAGVTDLSAAGCKSCNSLMRLVDDIYLDGGRLETRGWSLEQLKRLPGAPTRYLARVAQAERTLIGADGEVVDRTPATIVTMRFSLASSGDRTRVGELELVQ